MRLGTLNAGFVTSQGIEEIDRAVLAMQIPLATRTTAELDCVLEKMGPDSSAGWRRRGSSCSVWSDGGFVASSPRLRRARRMISSDEDVHWAGDDRYVELWKEAGFQPGPAALHGDLDGAADGLINALATTPERCCCCSGSTRRSA